eukprot:TRINITY_DN3865_c0_g1_i4.p1 TRINITY_DN3865_c0_g1~~TRINITY_DN3865_c0_g1_i4.p1  ORF type:complete len:268 (+),score=19.92 TRINITY_DN3865_c0_g1_i4:279-1082(+)
MDLKAHWNPSDILLKANTLGEPYLCLTSIVVGIFMCKILYGFTKLITSTLFKGFGKLTKAQQIEWSNRGISTGHAILITVVSIYILFMSDTFQDYTQSTPVTLRNTPFTSFMLGVSMGYFISDLAMIIWLYPTLGGMEYIVHHLLSISSIFLGLYTGDAHIYIFKVLLSESTTPSVNLRWYLDAAGLKKSKLYIVNGVFMFFAWLVARIILFIYIFIHMYMHYDEVKLIIPIGFWFLFIALPLFALMNVYWFWRILLGMKKTLTKQA